MLWLEMFINSEDFFVTSILKIMRQLNYLWHHLIIAHLQTVMFSFLFLSFRFSSKIFEYCILRIYVFHSKWWFVLLSMFYYSIFICVTHFCNSCCRFTCITGAVLNLMTSPHLNYGIWTTNIYKIETYFIQLRFGWYI